MNNSSLSIYICNCIIHCVSVTITKCKVWREPSVSDQRCVNTRLEVTLRLCYLYTYIKYILVSEIVIWLGSRRITSPNVENAENAFKIGVIRPENLPFNHEEMTDVLINKRRNDKKDWQQCTNGLSYWRPWS